MMKTYPINGMTRTVDCGYEDLYAARAIGDMVRLPFTSIGFYL